MQRLPKFYLFLVVALVAGLLLGWWGRGPQQDPGTSDAEAHNHDHAAPHTCSMHPQVRNEGPGDCPICGMDLIPVEEAQAERDSSTSNTVSLSPEERERARIRTTLVEKQEIAKNTELQGEITLDERRVFTQSAHFPGRVEELYLDYEGAYVQAGSLVAKIYSPMLVQAQQELIEAYQMREEQPQLYRDVLQKFKNWMIPEKDLQPILQRGKVKEAFPVRAHKSGYVLERLLEEGGHVMDGKAIYRMADISRLWVYLDLYREDLPWVRKGDSATVGVKAYPHRSFKGTLEWIAPEMNLETRSTPARLTIANPDEELRPGMLVEAEVASSLPGKDSALVVPHSAVLWTGKRSVVFTEERDDQAYSYQAREVILGPDLGDRYLIEEGLKPGERVASQGAFTLDAAAQLAGSPGMMKSTDEAAR